MTVEKEIVYVAGNPNFFPLEYYDPETKMFEGSIPDLFREFSRSSNYEIVYVDTKDKDLREEMYRAHQVDIISGWEMENKVTLQDGEEKIVFLQTTLNGDKEEYSVLLTKQASTTLKSQLRLFFAEQTQEEKIGIILKEVDEQTVAKTYAGFGYAKIAMTSMSLLLLVMLLLYLKKIRSIRQLALKDNETGIGNLEYLFRYYSKLVNDKNRVLYSAVYIATDIDNVYRQSDIHEVNQYLQYVVSLLKKSVNKSDILIRISGGTFLIIKMESSQEKLNVWIQSIIEKIRKYSVIYDKNFRTLAWAGIYELKKKDKNIDKIIYNAKQSYIYAKENSKMYYICTDDMLKIYEQKIRIEGHIKKAFEKDEFIFHLQFLVSAKTGKIIGAESMSRWQHPYEGLLFPQKYIPIMEKNNTIGYLDFEILKKICHLLEKIYSESPNSDFMLFCNFSKKTVSSPKFVENFMDVIEQYHFPYDALFLELTESKEYQENEIIYNNIEIIRKLGIRVIMDNYGTGHSRLENLNLDKFDGVKMDDKIINNLDTQMGEALIKAIIDMCHSLGKYVLAEGVNNKFQAEVLKMLGCDYIQGNYLYPATPEEEARSMYILERVRNSKIYD